MVIKFISITMTKAVTCPCCKKKFLRISQHFTLRPKCTLFVKRRLLSLDLLPSHRFKKNVMLKPDQNVKQRDFSDLYNPGSDTLIMEEDVACTESVSLGQEKLALITILLLSPTISTTKEFHFNNTLQSQLL